MGFHNCWLAKTVMQISAHWYSWQTRLISIHCSQKTFHFLSVSNAPTYILSNIVITLRKSHEITFVGYFRKIKNTCGRCFGDVSETSQKIHLFWDMLRRLQDVTQMTSFLRYSWDVLMTSQKDIFLRCVWDVLKMSPKSHLFWDVSKKSLRCLSQWRSDWDLSNTSHACWLRV